jgi:hypothetical protein
LAALLENVDPDTLTARDALALVYRLVQATKTKTS